MTLHESKHAGYTDLGRLHQPFIGEPPPSAPGQLPPGQAPPSQSPSAQPPPAQAPPAQAPPAQAPPAQPPAARVPSAPAPPSGRDAARSAIPVPGATSPSAALRADARQPQRSLYQHADFGPLRSDLDRPPMSGEEDYYHQLARIAEPEHWAGPASANRDATWVLREYIEWTFDRLLHQGQILTSSDGAHCVFNTGLATAQQEMIYGRFVPNRNPDAQPWQFAGWYPESDRQLLDHFRELPALATYTESPADYVYDARRELTVSPKHLLEAPENLISLPGPLRSNPYQAGLVLEGAVRRTEARVRRSYRAAVPCWDPAAERVQLLLPLSLTTPETVDVALVVAAEGQSYRGMMVLPLDIAYARARQIARPEEWLNGR